MIYALPLVVVLVLVLTVLIESVQAAKIKWENKIQTRNTHDAKEWVVYLLNGDKNGDTGSLHGSVTTEQ